MIPDTNLPLCCQAWASEQAHSSWHQSRPQSSTETKVAPEADPATQSGPAGPADKDDHVQPRKAGSSPDAK
jgi:hypothetical protein